MATCDCDSDILTIKKYLEGKVRNVKVPDNAILSICADAGVAPETYYADATQKQRDLALAWLYVWMSCSPTQSGGFSDENADWKHSDNGERMSAGVLKQYLSMANDIFDKYDLPTVGDENWGFVGRGFCNPRNTDR